MTLYRWLGRCSLVVRWPLSEVRRPVLGALEHGELLPEHEDLYDEACARAQGVDERAEQD